MVSDHAACVVASAVPFGYKSAVLALADERTDVGLVLCGVDDGDERVQGTVCVPKREDGVVRVGRVALVCLEVHAEVTSVDILEDIRRELGMVECRIEDGALVNGSGIGLVDFDVNAVQCVLPQCSGSLLGGIEVPTGLFRHQVSVCALGIHGADGRLQHDFLVLGGFAEVHKEFAAWLHPSVVAFELHGVAYDAVSGNGLACDGLEIETVVVLPPVVTPEGTDGIARHFHLHVQHGLVLDAVVEVENHARLFAFREGPSVDGRTACGGDFGHDAVAFEFHTVISRKRNFLLV